MYRQEAWEASPGWWLSEETQRAEAAVATPARETAVFAPCAQGPSCKLRQRTLPTPGGSSAEHPRPPPADLPGPAFQ